MSGSIVLVAFQHKAQNHTESKTLATEKESETWALHTLSFLTGSLTRKVKGLEISGEICVEKSFTTVQ